jgi:phosphate transport system substrate-binding protein
MPDPGGEVAYPIVTYTWMMFYKKYADAHKAEAIRQVVKYCLTDGQKLSGKMGYIPLPEPVVQVVSAALGNIQ